MAFDKKQLLDDPKQVIRKLDSFKTKIIRMDNKVRDYIIDRENNRHPWPDDLIDEIRRYENKIHAIPNKEIQMHLDSLLHSLLLYERIWRKALDRVS